MPLITPRRSLVRSAARPSANPLRDVVMSDVLVNLHGDDHRADLIDGGADVSDGGPRLQAG